MRLRHFRDWLLLWIVCSFLPVENIWAQVESVPVYTSPTATPKANWTPQPLPWPAIKPIEVAGSENLKIVPKGRWAGEKQPVDQIAFSPAGDLSVVVTANRTAHVLDPVSGE